MALLGGDQTCFAQTAEDAADHHSMGAVVDGDGLGRQRPLGSRQVTEGVQGERELAIAFHVTILVT